MLKNKDRYHGAAIIYTNCNHLFGIVGMANYNTSFQLRGQLWYHCGVETFNSSSSPVHTGGWRVSHVWYFLLP